MKKLGTLSSKKGKYTVTIKAEKLITPIMVGMVDSYEYQHKTVNTWGMAILCFMIEFKIVNKKEEEVSVYGYNQNKSKKEVTTR